MWWYSQLPLQVNCHHPVSESKPTEQFLGLFFGRLSNGLEDLVVSPVIAPLTQWLGAAAQDVFKFQKLWDFIFWPYCHLQLYILQLSTSMDSVNTDARRQRSPQLFLFIFLSNYKCKESLSVCLSVLRLSQQPFIRSTSHLVGVLLRTKGSAVLSVKLFGWAVLQKVASSNTGGHAIGPFWTGTFSTVSVNTGTHLQLISLNWNSTTTVSY